MELVRFFDSGKSTIGELYFGDEFICHTLELPWKSNERRVSAIPAGEYKVTIRPAGESSKFPYEHLELHDVPNRTKILIHAGNKPSHTLGCILVGTHGAQDDWISSSKSALKKLLSAVKDSGELTINIINK